MLLTITKVTVDRNKIISTVIYILCFCHDYVFFIFQFSSRTVMFNKKNWVEVKTIELGVTKCGTRDDKL